MKNSQDLLSIRKEKWVKNRKNNILKGDRLSYNRGIQLSYISDLEYIINDVVSKTEKNIIKFLKSETSREFFNKQEDIGAMDSSISSQSKFFINKLFEKFDSFINEKSLIFSERMVNKTQRYSSSSLQSSMRKLTGSVTLSTKNISPQLNQIMKSSIDENVALIKSMTGDYLDNVKKSLFRSITTGNGLGSVIETMEKYLDNQSRIVHNKAKNVALDQTRKVYTFINKQRMLEIGQKKFEWLHSGGSQNPREDHIEMNGKIYSLDNLPVIDKKTGQRGIPGEAINCKCTMNVIIEFNEGE